MVKKNHNELKRFVKKPVQCDEKNKNANKSLRWKNMHEYIQMVFEEDSVLTRRIYTETSSTITSYLGKIFALCNDVNKSRANI